MANTPPSQRRPLPQPESMSTKSSRRSSAKPLETSVNSNRPSSSKDTTTNPFPTARRFVPQLESTSIKSNRKGAAQSPSQNVASTSPNSIPVDANSKPAPKTSRFTPELVETTKRTRKSGDSASALRPSGQTDLSLVDQSHPPRHLKITRPGPLLIAPDNTPVTSTDQVPQVPESKFSSTNLSRKAPRRTSFRIPHLAPIQSNPDSDDSNDSNCPSLSTSPSITSDEMELYKHASRVRESCDDGSSGYLLALAARAAERQLREQAMAAYPNENIHEPVEHFAVDRDSEHLDEEIGTRRLLEDVEDEERRKPRRESAAGWDMNEMRRHQKMLKEQKQVHGSGENNKLKGAAVDATNDHATQKRLSDAAAAPKNIIGGWQKGIGLNCMRNAANPPMLGHNLQFPKCMSPQQTRIDATQFPCSRAGRGVASRQHSGLWAPDNAKSRRSSAGGLWNGVCAAPDEETLSPPKVVQSGLMTPRMERDNSLANTSVGGTHQLPHSPASPARDSISAIDELLAYEEDLELEFNDGFVTQIYNYLSIGYPALARKYDEELSKISKLPIEELRRDDTRKDTRGYVGAPEGNRCDEQAVQDGQCGRWWALRLYIREWARQQPRMVDGDGLSDKNWGVRARRGSWAI